MYMVTSRMLAACLAASSLVCAASDKGDTSAISPSLDLAKSRGPQIFNAVHDSMRQWGASFHHNGMSFFLATVPEGVILHYGSEHEASPHGPEWLAYEMEHAEGFARRRPDGGFPGAPPPDPVEGLEHRQGQTPLISSDDSMGADESAVAGETGWLHTYRAIRPLRYLYVDGMGGGKTVMGTLDSQDYILRGQRTGSKLDPAGDESRGKHTDWLMDERQRAAELCALCKQWNLSGIIRMEAGFEIIQCDFAEGLEALQVLQRPSSGDEGRYGPGGPFERIRGAAERYDGVGSSRTIIDYSSMVSAYFFPINITNPDPNRPDLPRLSSATDSELAAIRKWLNETIEHRFDDRVQSIDWQDVTDLIVGRYADRIKFMAEKTTSAGHIARVLAFLLTMFMDGSGNVEDQISAAIDRCTTLYLHGVQPVTDSDHLISAAVRAVSAELCTRLFNVRKIVTTGSVLGDPEAFTHAVSALRSLMDYLNWARFKRCAACDLDEVCLIPMWPWGSKEAYDSPRCVNSTSMDEGETYWDGWIPDHGG